MSTWTGGLPAVVLALGLSAAQAVSLAAVNVELDRKLIELGKRDQQIRQRVPTVVSSAGLQSAEFKALAEEMAKIDGQNFAELEKIIEQFGWPGTDLVSVEGGNAAFLILQHATLAQQKRLLPLFRRAVSEGKARAQHLALLEDRVLVREGRQQLYGSQITSGPDGTSRVDPVEDPQNLDTRRQQMGLPPMEEYLKHLEVEIGKPIDRTAIEGK